MFSSWNWCGCSDRVELSDSMTGRRPDVSKGQIQCAILILLMPKSGCVGGLDDKKGFIEISNFSLKQDNLPEELNRRKVEFRNSVVRSAGRTEWVFNGVIMSTVSYKSECESSLPYFSYRSG